MVVYETPYKRNPMFNKLRRRHQTVSFEESQQIALDVLRVQYADDQWMQLHLDRMQTALGATR